MISLLVFLRVLWIQSAGHIAHRGWTPGTDRRDGGEDVRLWDDCDGAIGRQTFGFRALFCVNTFANYRSNRTENPISVLYIYCTIPNRVETSSDHVCRQTVAYCVGRECNVIEVIFNVFAGMKILHTVTYVKPLYTVKICILYIC